MNFLTWYSGLQFPTVADATSHLRRGDRRRPRHARLGRQATFTRVLQFERVIPPDELAEGLNYASVHMQVPPPTNLR
jgi:hypothetical protein